MIKTYFRKVVSFALATAMVVSVPTTASANETAPISTNNIYATLNDELTNMSREDIDSLSEAEIDTFF